MNEFTPINKPVAEVLSLVADIDVAYGTPMREFTVSVAARLLDCSVATIQQYDRKGLFPLPRRKGCRVISRETLILIAQYRQHLQRGPYKAPPPPVVRIPLLPKSARGR